jgi:hypothetical protein
MELPFDLAEVLEISLGRVGVMDAWVWDRWGGS